MGLFDFLKPKKETASIAKDRLRIIVAQERTTRGAPDYLPMLQRELLEVIKKYVQPQDRPHRQRSSIPPRSKGDG